MWGMTFNTVKCVVMTITNKSSRKTIDHTYDLNNTPLLKKDYIKYLGVTIDSKLTFRKHTEEKIKSATNILNLLRRNLYFAPKSVKSKAYLSCVRPILEYANVCWSPTSQKFNQRLEMVQHKAAKFASGIYPKKGHYESFSISNILKNLNWKSLAERRTESRLCMAYKIITDKVILDPSLLPKSDSRTPRSCNEVNVGHRNKLLEQTSRLEVPGKTFFLSVPTLWNHHVTKEQANAPSVDAFKRHFNN